MYGHLIPCSGGEVLPLSRTRMYLGRRVGDAPSAPLNSENALCQLELHDGWWHLEDLRAPQGVKVNGRACKRERLQPDDEIAIGRHRFRIQYTTPKAGAKAKPPGSGNPKSAPLHRMDTPGFGPDADSGVLGRLVLLGGGDDLVLSKASVTFGRSSSCDLTIPSSKVSSKHGRLDFQDGHWRIHDLGSTNGIRVDGVKVEEAWVYPGGEIALGDLRLRLEYTPRGPRPMQDLVVTRPTKSLLDQLGVSAEELSNIVASHPEEDDIPQRPRYDLLKDL